MGREPGRESDRGGQERFRIAQSEFTMPVPEGYCLPEGDAAAAVQVTASIDQANLTLADFGACGRDLPVNYFDDYIILKTPRNALTLQANKPEFFPLLGAALKELPIREIGDQGAAEAQRQLSELAGRETAVEFRVSNFGSDDECHYMHGSGMVGTADNMEPGVMVACLTIRGPKIITVYAYNFMDAPDVEGMRAVVRKVALSIEPVVAD